MGLRIIPDNVIRLGGRGGGLRAFGGESYIMLDLFSGNLAAGDVNGSVSDSGHEREIIDSNSWVSVNSGITFADGPAAAPYGDPSLTYADFTLARQLGKVLRFSFDVTGGPWLRFGLDTSPVGTPTKAIFLNETQGVYVYNNATNWSWVYPGLTGVSNFALITRSLGSAFFIQNEAGQWILVHLNDYDSTAALKPLIATFNFAVTCKSIKHPTSKYYPSPLISDNLSGALLSSVDVGDVSPQLGVELLSDTSLEAAYTAGLCGSLTKAGSPTLSESADAHTGSKAQQFTGVANADRVIWPNKTPVLGVWYRAAFYAKRTVGTAGNVVFRFFNGGTQYIYALAPIISSTYERYAIDVLAMTTDALSLHMMGVGINTDTVLMDDGSLSPFVTSSLFAGKDYSKNNVSVSAAIAMAGYSSAGVFACLDSLDTPENYIVAHIAYNGSSIVPYLYLRKVVSGVPENIAAPAAISYVAASRIELIKNGTAVSVKYNGTSVASGSVADAGIVSNTIHGKFSTDTSNAISDLAVNDSGTLISDGRFHAEYNSDLGAGGGGVAWTVRAGTIVSNGDGFVATALSGDRAIATVTMTTPDVIIPNIPFVKGTIGCGLVLRYVDADNYIYVWWDGTDCNLVKRVAGVESAVLSGHLGVVGAAVTIGASCLGTNWSQYINNYAVLNPPNTEDGLSIINELLTGTAVGVIFFDLDSTIGGFQAYAKGTEGQYGALK